MKICLKCNIEKENNEFYKRKASKDGLTIYCKPCIKEMQDKRKDKITEYSKEYYPQWREKNKEKIRVYKKEYWKKRIKSDIDFKLKSLLRGRLYKAVKRDTKMGSAVKDLGCSIKEFKIYIEKQFKDGMSWSNWGTAGWHLDHIKPLNSFNLHEREDLLKAIHYTNLQPMWARDNFSKGDKILET